MVDFRSHLEKGVQAYERAQAFRKEIADVLSALSSAVENYTDGLVGIRLNEEVISVIAKGIAALSISGPKVENISTYNLVAYNATGDIKLTQILSTWAQANTGYPCTLHFDNTKHEVYDRQALEKALASLLSSPDTGRAIAVIRDAVIRDRAKKAAESQADIPEDIPEEPSGPRI